MLKAVTNAFGGRIRKDADLREAVSVSVGIAETDLAKEADDLTASVTVYVQITPRIADEETDTSSEAEAEPSSNRQEAQVNAKPVKRKTSGKSRQTTKKQRVKEEPADVVTSEKIDELLNSIAFTDGARDQDSTD